MRRIGCLIIIVILAIAAWLTRASWLPLLPFRITGRSAPAAAAPTWQAMSVSGAARARDALEQLNKPNGPASVVVTPGDLGSYIFQELSRSLPPSADSIQAAAIGDRLYVRAVVRTSELGGANGLGPLGALLGERELLAGLSPKQQDALSALLRQLVIPFEPAEQAERTATTEQA